MHTGSLLIAPALLSNKIPKGDKNIKVSHGACCLDPSNAQAALDDFLHGRVRTFKQSKLQRRRLRRTHQAPYDGEDDPEGEVALGEDLGGQGEARPRDDEHECQATSPLQDPLIGVLHGSSRVGALLSEAYAQQASHLGLGLDTDLPTEEHCLVDMSQNRSTHMTLYSRRSAPQMCGKNTAASQHALDPKIEDTMASLWMTTGVWQSSEAGHFIM